MKTENRTSLAVEAILFFDEENLKNAFDIQLKAIKAKYLKMEEALRMLSKMNPSSKQVLVIEDALAFDPLSLPTE